MITPRITFASGGRARDKQPPKTKNILDQLNLVQV